MDLGLARHSFISSTARQKQMSPNSPCLRISLASCFRAHLLQRLNVCASGRQRRRRGRFDCNPKWSQRPPVGPLRVPLWICDSLGTSFDDRAFDKLCTADSAHKLKDEGALTELMKRDINAGGRERSPKTSLETRVERRHVRFGAALIGSPEPPTRMSKAHGTATRSRGELEPCCPLKLGESHSGSTSHSKELEDHVRVCRVPKVFPSSR